MATFSERNNHREEAVPITIREDAPQELRSFVISTALRQGLKLDPLRTIVCAAVRDVPDANNWSENNFMKQEVEAHLYNNSWFYTYDAIELIYAELPDGKADAFADQINFYLRRRGIGWQLNDGQIIFRGDDQFEEFKTEAAAVLEAAGKPTAKAEISEAIKDLSKRPEPDLTGAIQHALAGLECVVREVTSNEKHTLGKLINDNPDIVPKPLNEAISKLYGYASNNGRHLKEGGSPNLEEVELTVAISASLVTYLAKKNFGQTVVPAPAADFPW